MFFYLRLSRILKFLIDLIKVVGRPAISGLLQSAPLCFFFKFVFLFNGPSKAHEFSDSSKFTEITRDSAGSELEQYSDEDYDGYGRGGGGRGGHGRGDTYSNRRKR